MIHDLVLALASIAIVLSPCLFDTPAFRGMDRSNEEQLREWPESMTS